MAASPRTLLMALAVTASATIGGYEARAATADVLSPMDVKAYREAFAAAARGDFDAADRSLARVKDESLAGHLALQKLMHPTAHKAEYEELTDWLKAYGDHPGADRVYALALKRKPAGAAEPRAPAFVEASRGWARVESAASRAAGPATADRDRQAREAYYSGEIERALALAPAAGNAWIAGLSAWRLGRYEDARNFFRAVAVDEDEDDWLRAGGAFWAARASRRLGDAPQAAAFLRMAARTPHSFYGMIAQRSLELGEKELASVESYARPVSANEGLLIRVATAPAPAPAGPAAFDALLQKNPRARRAAALMQVGRPADAGLELRAGLSSCKTAAERRPWEALILALNAPITSAADSSAPPPLVQVARRKPSRPSAPVSYPTPDLWPEGGWTLDKALVYALIWKESGFNPFAVSGAGAMGLMQVRPVAAARAAGDDKLISNPMPLLDAPTNLRVGQDYFTWLMERGLGGGPEGYDLLRAVAAYNAGAGTVLNTLKKVGPEADTLLVIESLPALETRDYVEKVAAAYWSYRRKFGSDTPTLDAVARGERLVDIRLDR
ncbi:lytic transglycosylase domain-containing protein [Caulobacter mirabilis]|nr:lytic transglycosylase domain-containing protein [Caulobacter mirabilis]